MSAITFSPRTTEDRDKYARHRLIDWWDQATVARSRVVVAGAGAIGNEVIKLLALVGVGHVLVIDFDVVEASNLTRSVLFREEDIGKPKAAVAAARARELNPDLSVRFIQGDLEQDIGLGALRQTDLALGCLDSIGARVALNAACMRAGVPWINGGISIAEYEVAMFVPDSGACYQCTMTPAMWARHNRHYSCSGLRLTLPDNAVPTTATTASVVAGHMVHQALLKVHASDETLRYGLRAGERLFGSMHTLRTVVSELSRDPECSAHEQLERVVIVPFRSAQTSVRELVSHVGQPGAAVELGFDLVVSMTCPECRVCERILRPASKCSEAMVRCPACSEDRVPVRVSTVAATDDAADVPLAALGLPPFGIVLVRDADAITFVQLDGACEFQRIGVAA